MSDRAWRGDRTLQRDPPYFRAKDLLSGEHFSEDGTLIQRQAVHKRFVRKGVSDEHGDNFRGASRSNETHGSATTNALAQLCRQDNTASQLRCLCHNITDNRYRQVASAVVTTHAGDADQREAAKAMVNTPKQAAKNAEAEVTLVAAKGYGSQDLSEACMDMNVTPHVAQNTSGRRSAVPEAITSRAGYALSRRKRKLIEQGFDWTKTLGRIRQVMVRGLSNVDPLSVLTMAAYNLTHMRTLGEIRL